MSHLSGAWPLPPLLAHRCGGLLAPENTLAGLFAGAAAGCRGVEFDVQLSADGTPVLFHDVDLLRLTGVAGRLDDTGDVLLSRLRVGAGLPGFPAGESVPTLAAALEVCARLGLAANVELKVDEPGAVRLVLAVAPVLKAFLGQVPMVLSSFADGALRAAADLVPVLPRGLLLETVTADWRSRLTACAASALHLEESRWDAVFVRTVLAAGVAPVAWTVNDPARARQLRAWGVCTVISDHPGLPA